MIHVWDHFDHTNDVQWWRRQGWPLLKVNGANITLDERLILVKGAASFHLEKLIEDLYFNDSTLVTSPCNSPEQPPITFGMFQHT